jgi:septal ring factor EnvC (AmiA/AmiB activator)
MIEQALNQIDVDIASARQELNAFNGMIGTVETERKELLDDIKAQKARIGEIKKTNDKTFRKYEEDLRSLNQGFIVGRMVGESDQDYKDRLLTFERENVEAITQQEAAMYNNRVFKIFSSSTN